MSVHSQHVENDPSTAIEQREESVLCVCACVCAYAYMQFVPGPGNDTLTIVRLVSRGWDFWYVVSTLRNVVAPQRPLPRQAAFTQKYR